MAKRLRIRPGPPQLGHNVHVLTGHQRLDFVRKYTKPGYILDAACGEGAFAMWAAAHPIANNVYAIDINDPGARLKEYPIKFKQVSLEDYKTTLTFDTIYLMEIIEHLEEPAKIVAKMYKRLKDDGRLLITTPHVGDWDWEEDHLWRWSLEEFDKMIQEIDPDAEIWKDDIFLYAVLIMEK
ncbi:MAG: class I SAM-dependent methyltransferase [Candidatus Thorarchaeota archaeon]|jgi:2-polyprenyl-3-methyl-5-hydroxy-6-metoxy-1,4-benzoquinol methylase